MAAASRSMEIKVGALVLVAVSMLVAFLLLLGDFHFSARSTLLLDLPNSGDLKPGAPVKITGVTVGKVSSLDLWGGRPDPANGRDHVDVRAVLRLQPEALGMLHDDAVFAVSTQGILGERYVEITPGSQERPILADGRLVVGTGPAHLEAVATDVSNLATEVGAVLRDNRDDLREIVKATRNVVGRLDTILAGSSDDARAAIADLRKVTSALAQAAGDGQDLKATVAALKGVAVALDRQVPPVLADLPRLETKVEHAVDEATALMGDARAVVASGKADLGVALANVRAITQQARDPRSTIGAFLSDREMYDDLVSMMKDLKRHPWKLFWKE